MSLSEIIISTEAVEPCLRSDFWREVTLPIFDAMPVDGAASMPMTGAIRSRAVGGLLIGTIAFNAQRYRRDRRIIAQGGLDHYQIVMLTAGSMQGLFGQRSVKADPGDICIVDLACPFENEVDAGTRLTTAVPRKNLENVLGRRDLHGVVLKAGWPMTQLLTDYLQGLKVVSARLSVDEGNSAQEAMGSLLAASLLGKEVTGCTAGSALNGALRERMIEFIGAHLTSTELSPELLMCRFQISRANLYRILAEDGGVSTLIRNKRLDAAYLALRYQRGRERSITTIATEYGFSSGAQFLRAFRSRFGFTPSDAKREGTMPALEFDDSSHMLHRHFVTYCSSPETGLGERH